jgi:hypothetical protein
MAIGYPHTTLHIRAIKICSNYTYLIDLARRNKAQKILKVFKGLDVLTNNIV